MKMEGRKNPPSVSHNNIYIFFFFSEVVSGYLIRGSKMLQWGKGILIRYSRTLTRQAKKKNPWGGGGGAIAPCSPVVCIAASFVLCTTYESFPPKMNVDVLVSLSPISPVH